jgi:hypothetical protein
MKLSSAVTVTVVVAVVSCALLVVSIEARRAQLSLGTRTWSLPMGSHAGQRQSTPGKAPGPGGHVQQTGTVTVPAVAPRKLNLDEALAAGRGIRIAGRPPQSPCKTCTFVVERVKLGTGMLMPSLCTELFEKEGDKAYADCHQVLNVLQENGNNFRHWLGEGCYNHKLWYKPCPSHQICSFLKNPAAAKEFCPPPGPAMENPFSSGKPEAQGGGKGAPGKGGGKGAAGKGGGTRHALSLGHIIDRKKPRHT